jgi:hypothetical protein
MLQEGASVEKMIESWEKQTIAFQEKSTLYYLYPVN